MTTLYILQAIQVVAVSFLIIKVNKELKDIFQTLILQARINEDLNKRVKELELKPVGIAGKQLHDESNKINQTKVNNAKRKK